MSLYDEVLNCPDTHCRKEALDKLCKEKVAEGMEKAVHIVAPPLNLDADILRYEVSVRKSIMTDIRQAAKDLEDE